MAPKSKNSKSGKTGKASNASKTAREDNAPVKLTTTQYRSMIMAKLRSDITAKQAALATASVAGIADLANMSYWKMAYWKMKYWKMGHVENPLDAIVLPAAGKLGKAQK